ncbi:MAG: hypothetical protein O7B99_01325 [Planctomycetota bacterium]|nr:hypothetical protein [Planctomycetota bacterium]
MTKRTLVGLALLATGCATQRFPGPMEQVFQPLPPGDVTEYPPGPQEVVVFRLSDPVMVRRSGEPVGYPMRFYSKKERLKSGSWVLVAAGGRAEILWPDDASSVVIFDEGVCVIGEPSREESMLSFRKITRARLMLTPEDRVELMGGAVLTGSPERTSGPFVLDRIKDDILRVINQSKQVGQIAVRDGLIELRPGEYVDLPLLSAGGEPFTLDPLGMEFSAGGIDLFVTGAVEELPTDEGVRLRAVERSQVRGLGVTFDLAPGEELLLAGPPPQILPPQPDEPPAKPR